MNLFQHHDGITGTSKNEVMADYGQKMFEAMKKSEEIIITAADFLLRGKTSRNLSIPSSFLMEENLRTSESFPMKRIVVHESEVILFNSLGNLRMETICVHVNALNTVVVLASEPNITVLQQIGPVLEFVHNKWVIDSKLYELCFVSTVPPLSFQKYLFKSGAPHDKATIRLSSTGLQSSDFDIAPLGDFTFDNGLISATFDPETVHIIKTKEEYTSKNVVRLVWSEDEEPITAEILYSFMGIKGFKEGNALRLFGLLVEARRWMNLFQHHDGITGTSKNEVMADYGQ
ncbi:hypothetical protein WUBG_13099, partial [Wuchereria bancrofti]